MPGTHHSTETLEIHAELHSQLVWERRNVWPKDWPEIPTGIWYNENPETFKQTT